MMVQNDRPAKNDEQSGTVNCEQVHSVGEELVTCNEINYKISVIVISYSYGERMSN